MRPQTPRDAEYGLEENKPYSHLFEEMWDPGIVTNRGHIRNSNVATHQHTDEIPTVLRIIRFVA